MLHDVHAETRVEDAALITNYWITIALSTIWFIGLRSSCVKIGRLAVREMVQVPRRFPNHLICIRSQ